jgi:superfamily II DNA helicase RecQ
LIDILRPRKYAKPDNDTNAGILSSGSVIIYVWRQRDAEAVAENIQAAGDVRGGITVYHGGMDAAARSKAQSKVRFENQSISKFAP